MNNVLCLLYCSFVLFIYTECVAIVSLSNVTGTLHCRLVVNPPLRGSFLAMIATILGVLAVAHQVRRLCVTWNSSVDEGGYYSRCRLHGGGAAVRFLHLHWNESTMFSANDATVGNVAHPRSTILLQIAPIVGRLGRVLRESQQECVVTLYYMYCEVVYTIHSCLLCRLVYKTYHHVHLHRRPRF